MGNGGDRVRVEGANGETILDFQYVDSWHPTTDGEGFSLTVTDPRGNLARWSTSAGWRPSRLVGGSPGTRDAAAADFDFDGDVDLADFLRFGECFTPAGAAHAPGCAAADFDFDGDVDLADLLVFQARFSGAR